MSEFTAQQLAWFYQKVADGGEIQYGIPKAKAWTEPLEGTGPVVGSDKSMWRLKPDNESKSKSRIKELEDALELTWSSI